MLNFVFFCKLNKKGYIKNREIKSHVMFCYIITIWAGFKIEYSGLLYF